MINAEGFIRHSRIYEGNKADTTTLEDMLEDLQRHSPEAKQTVVMDAGIATEDNLALVRKKKDMIMCAYPVTDFRTILLIMKILV